MTSFTVDPKREVEKWRYLASERLARIGELEARCEKMRDWMRSFGGSSLWEGKTVWENFIDAHPQAASWFEEETK